ncbi:hypothetical protein EW145_g6168 [Phellinidium pouzarii]|uniref:Beta-lactamase-related domain-containing protein n=1 Tax=Phellinidium pouzarii TaxID=167371 RepID=A0A4S4KXI0_9AGAM|nr:hypothetical protein EW145_g6168 [Phellinidium pouzarii]
MPLPESFFMLSKGKDFAPPRSPTPTPTPTRCVTSAKTKLVTFVAALVVVSLVYTPPYRFFQQDEHLNERQCRAPLPQFLDKQPPSSDHPALRQAARHLDGALTTHFIENDIDSIAVAVVTSEGSVYEGFWGALRANETDEDKRGVVDRQSIYRLASISKLFTALETFILRDRGVFNLDDSLDKLFPKLSHYGDDPITVRQLMSHMSGLGRDWPPGNAEGVWPESLEGTGPPWYNGLPFPSDEEFMEGIIEYPLVAPPYTFPSYSNTGYSLLGLANVAANKKDEGNNAPATHADLLHRDIFAPLGLNGSSFVSSDANKANAAVASLFSEETDLDFGDATNPAGGQMSSLSDLVKLMQTLIDPTRPERLLRPSTVREWMKPMYAWWDEYSEVGALWEIYKFKDSFGKTLRQYQKLGELIGHHTAFTINPASSFGVIILTTGPTMQTDPLNKLVFSHFQPAFDVVAKELTSRLLVGKWTSADGHCVVSIAIEAGSLYVSEYSINGTDVLRTIHPDGIPRPTALWYTGGNKFRLAVGAPDTGCLFQWATLDQYAYSKGFATNHMQLVGYTLKLPAIGVDLKRV